MYVAWRDGRNYPTTDDDLYLQRMTADGAVAQGWPPSGLPICRQPRFQAPNAIVPDGVGGAVVIWIDGRDGPTNATDLYAIRIRGDGTIAPGWQPEGTPVFAEARYEHQSNAAATEDGDGGAFFVWQDKGNNQSPDLNVYAQHLTAEGAIAPGWQFNGAPVCSLELHQGLWVGTPVAAPGGGFVTVWDDGRSGTQYDNYAQRIMGDGSIAPGWAVNGNLINPNRRSPMLAACDTGSFYAASATPYHLYDGLDDAEYYVDRYTFGGVRLPGWPEGGVLVCSAPDIRGGLATAADGAGGVLLAWHDYRPTPEIGWIQIHASRLLPDGTIAPGWDAGGGTRVSDVQQPGYHLFPSIVADGNGGMYLTWAWESGSSNVLVQHLNPTGFPAAGWPQGGLEVSTSLGQFDPRIVTDGAGGAIVVWEEAGGTGGRLGLYAQRYYAGGPTPTAVSLVSAEAEPDRVQLVWHGERLGDLSSTVYRRSADSEWQPLGSPAREGDDRVRFEDRSVTPGARYAYRLGYLDEGAERFTTETWVDVPPALALTLNAPRPNPATRELFLSFVLPHRGPARIEVLDVAGRQRLTDDVGALGPGSHVVRLDGLSTLEPGVFWVRLTQGNERRLTKAVIAR